MTIYNLTVLANPTMNGRSTPSSSTSTNLIFPNGFKNGDVLKANLIALTSGITWYGVYECLRSGAPVSLPATTVWVAASDASRDLLRLDSTVTEPPPVVTVFPKEIWVSMTVDGERKKYILVV